MGDRPQRRWTVEVVSGGDTWEDAAALLREMADHLEAHGRQCDMVHGGPRAGGFVRVTERPEMTAQRYREALDAWLDGIRPPQPAKAKGGE